MLPTLASLLTLITTLFILYKNLHSDLSTPHLSILYTTIAIASLSTLYTLDAEPWAYLLCLAGLSLYTTIRTFYRKYHKISLKGPREGSNRRARRRER
jgi:hypothetical protein